jgi:hypothetical protein
VHRLPRGGDVVLPDFGEENPDTPIAKARAAARREREREGPHQLIARPPRQETVPTGLRALPPAPSAPAAKNGRPRPAVADLGLLKPPQPERATEPVVPATRTPEQPPASPVAAADGPAVAGTAPPPRKRPGPKKPIAHGTYKGAQQHYRKKIPIPSDDPCGCRKAMREAKAAQSQRRRDRHQALLDAAAAVLAQRIANPPDPVAQETQRLIAAGVNPECAAVIAPLGVGHRPLARPVAPVQVPGVDRVRPGPAATVGARPLLPTDLDRWFAAAADSPDKRVRAAARYAAQTLTALRHAMDSLTRAERAAGRRTA